VSKVSSTESVIKLSPISLLLEFVLSNNNLLASLPFITCGIPAVGAFVNVNVVPLTLHTVAPVISVGDNNLLSR